MILGRTASGPLALQLPKLLETRALVQANSGGGKSYLLRRLLEQTAPHVQQLVIDPEGEFATLREKFDFIIAAPHDGDAVATPKTAALLARRLLETGVSAILDIYDLKAHERQAFVSRFLGALVNAPRALWHPVLIVIDEAHVFCPQAGGAEAAGAVIDICTRGRKRGLCPVLATQRLSKLHKDAAAEMLNKLIGRTGLDVDVKRAADELGLVSRDATATLRNLKPGEFFAFGPALATEVVRLEVGPVATTHPESGRRLMTAPPAPSKRVLASLAKLADLQKDADEEARTLEQLTATVADLRRKVTLAEKRAEGAGVPEAEVTRRIQSAVAAAKREAAPAPVPSADAGVLREVGALAHRIVALTTGESGVALAEVKRATRAAVAHAPRPREVTTPRPAGQVSGLRAGAVRILQELAARAPAGYSRAQVGTLTGFSPKGGTFNTYLGDLRRAGAIEERDGLVYATEAGIVSLGAQVPAKPTSHADAMALWNRALRAGAFRMLEFVVETCGEGATRQEIADGVGMESRGGTFNTYLGDLRRNGLVAERGGRVVASDILFPKGAK